MTNEWWYGLVAGVLCSVVIRELGSYMRRGRDARTCMQNDSDLILATLEAAGVDKAGQFDALVAVQKLTLANKGKLPAEWTEI